MFLFSDLFARNYLKTEKYKMKLGLLEGFFFLIYDSHFTIMEYGSDL